MTRDKDASLKDYLAQAQSWELDRAQQADRSKRLAWAIAGAATILALVEAIALASLTPLKQVTPFVVRVDNSTGLIDVVPTYTGTQDPGELVTRTLLNTYVIARERYFYGTAEPDFEQVAAMHPPAMNQDWAARWNKANPQSPLNLYKDGTTVRVQVRSISFLKMASQKVAAQVRFTRYTRPGGTGDEQAAHWVATIDYAYTAPSRDEKLRSLNPLGFKVIEYHREPEVATQPVARGSS